MNSAPLQLKIQVVRLPSGRDLELPCYLTPGSAGMDLQAAANNPIHIAPGERTAVPTGLAISLPLGYEAQIRPRSGLAVKHGIGLINAPGTIDADYRGEVMIAVINLGKAPYTFHRGDRIAQMVIQKIYRTSLQQVAYLEETQRNTGGFGHTGL